MDQEPRPRRLAWLLSIVLGLTPAARAQTDDDPSKGEDTREQQVMERFLTLLEKSPRRGTALDRVYGYHVERGSLEAFIKTYQDRVAKDPKDGPAWLLLGLLESQRGHDAASVTALRKAEDTRPDDSLPSYYLGRALVLVGQPDSAAEAFERAIARKPARTDLLEIYQALGRVHQRAQRHDKALDVWGRLEKAFPDDLRVQEQIAAALAEESHPEQALERYEAIAGKVKDEYQRVTFRIEAADLKVRLNRTNDALKDFETLLNKLNPDSWLYREVRRKIEEVFLRNDDQNGLAKYYTAWVEKNPEDVEAMSRLGRTLASLGRAAEARPWFDKAVKLAPSRRSLRQALIEQLVQEKKFAEAASHYEAMAKADPGNPDTIREWGRLLLRDPARSEAERKRAAADVWRKLVEAKPDDPTIAIQVADLFRQAELSDDAITLYKKAIALAPKSTQYYEYLGEYYHTLKRPDEAKATWSEIASGANKNAKNLARLSEVLAGFGYKIEAVEAAAAAVALEGDSFELRMQYAKLLHQLERFDDDWAQLDAAAKLADNEDQREGVLMAQITNLAAAGRLGQAIETLRGELDRNQDATAERWQRLARYHEAEQQLPEATAAIRKAVALDPKSVSAWTTSARLHEGAGDLGAAVEAYQTLVKLDRRNRAEYLTNIAKLESKRGRRDDALKAGRDLLAAAPGNPEHYQFFAELCFGIGEVDQGLDTLRRSVRLNPNDSKVLLALAEALAQQFRTEEAIELFWRAFDKTTELDARLGVVARLTDLYLQRNQFDRLVARLEREQREVKQQREMALCLAAAYQASGDFGAARRALEKLAASNARDTVLLGQLSGLAEREGDYTAAAKYQQQVIEVTPSDEGSVRLADLLARTGDIDGAEAVWERLATGEQSSYRTIQALDNLLAHEKYEAVLRTTEKLLLQRPGDWEAIYREGAALMGLKKDAEAARRFRAMLALRTDDDELSTITKALRKGLNTTARLPGMPAPRPIQKTTIPLQDRLNAIWQVRAATGLEPRYYYSVRAFSWSPTDFGQARMAAMAFLLVGAQRANQNDQALDAFRDAAAKATAADPRPRWDWYYLNLARNEARDTYEAAREVARLTPGDPAALWVYLNSLSNRASSQGINTSANAGTAKDRVAPLRDAEIDALVTGFETLRRRKPEWVQAQILTNVAAELKRAKRKDQEERFYREAIAAASTSDALLSVLTFSGSRDDVEGVLSLFDRYSKVRKGRVPTAYMSAYADSDALAHTMLSRADAKAHGDVLRVLDHYLAAARREQSGAGRRGSRAWSAMNQQTNFHVWLSKTPRSTQVDFPAPNDYFDLGAIQLLREAFELYKRDDLLSDLFAHITAQAEKGPEAERVPGLLALSYLHWWNDEKNDALKRHEQAGAAAKNEPALRLELAELHEKRGEPTDALATADAVEPLDQATLQRREHLALRLAVATGNVDRARKASERLFGLRLDTDTQVRLAGQMHQLAMHELAETVLARARRRAGNRSDSLMALMQQYQKQNKAELAVQVAHQLLRKAPTQQSMPGYYVAEDQYRHQAIQTLARSGKLKELIERAEAQLAASPQSMPILQTLVDYYTADGQKDKVRATYDRMANIRPGDAKLRMQIAEQMLRSGDNAAAIGHFRVAFTKEPVLLGFRYWEVQNAFQTADRLDDLITIYEEIDLRATGNVWGVGQLAQGLLQDSKRRERGLKLFRKAWQAFPTQRPYLIANLESPEVWKLPELYEFVRDGVMPRAGQAAAKPWLNLEDRIFGNAPDGRLTTVVTRLLEVAARQNKLGALEQDIQSALKAQPEWLAGQAILALVRARRGHTLEARRELEALSQNTAEPMPALARWVIGQELEEIPALEDLAVAMYEAGLKEDDEDDQGGDFDNSPVRRLVALYKRAGRIEDGRRILATYAAKGPGDRYSFDPDYEAYMRVRWIVSLGQRFLDLGAPAETIRLYNEMLNDTATLQTAANWGGGDSETAMREGMKKALQNMNRDTVSTTLEGLLRPPADPRAPAALDLVLLIQPRELDRAAVVGLMGTALRSAADEPDLLAKTKARLAKLAEERPKDLTVQTASTLAVFAEGKPDAIDAATARLARLVDETPLETLAPGARANSRQRADAIRQVGLWLVARECWNHDSVRAVGDKLADRALDAARRQSDSLWALAMLRERGRHALERGDRAATERTFSRMIEHVFAGNSDQNTQPEPSPEKKGKTDAKPAVIPITLDRFQQAAQIAVLAARSDLPEVSFRAIRQALRGGPPIVPPPSNNSRFVRSSNQETGSPEEKTAMQVESRIAELETLWREHGVPAAAIYETLRDIALPEARPSEIFVFARPFTYRAGAPNLKEPRSVAVLLARWAVRAGKVDDLRRRINERLDQPLASLAGQILLAHLSREADDAEAATKALAALGQRLEKDSHDATAKLAYQVALPSLRSRTSAKPALSLLDSAVKNLAKETSNEPLATFQLELAQLRFDQSDAAEGTRLVKDFLALYERSQQRQNGNNIEYQNHQKRQWLSRGAAALAQGGQWDETLDALGLVADVKENAQNYWWGDTGSLTRALAAFGRHLASRPAAERYARLKAWTLPTGERKQVRLLAAFLATEDSTPAAFGQTAETHATTDLACTAVWLVEAAREAGKLDELAGALAQVEVPKDEIKEKDEGAPPNALQTLRLLVALARGRTEEVRPALESRLAALLKVGEGDAEQRMLKTMVSWPDYLLTRACIADTQLAPLGERLARRLIERDPSAFSAEYEDSFPTRLRLDLMRRGLARSGGEFPALGLSHWQAASHHRASDTRNQSGRPIAAPAVAAPGLWVERDGTIAHLGGPGDQFLIFDAPLEGRFEISVETFVGRDASGLLGYGGLVLEPSVRPAQQQWWYGNTPEIIPPSAVWPFGRNERVSRTCRFLAKDAFNRVSVQVEPGKVRYLINGHLFYEDENAGTTSPFLALGGVKTTQAVFRNLVITGEPVVPREVRLSQGDRLDGWIASFYDERLPVTRQGIAPPDPDRPYQPATELSSIEEYDWYARDGVIHGRVQPSSGLDPAQSRLYHHRPLRDGETIAYEFYYEPGAILTHPALGRLAFLLDPSGVRLHWMTANDGLAHDALTPDNHAEEPEHRRGRLDLKPAAWNAVTLSLKGRVATLVVNGTAVYERPIESSNDLLFGFYHDKAQTAAWVRNVVLKGPWSDAQRAQPFARRDAAPGDERVREALIGERFLGLSAGDVLARARSLAPTERYELLREWVLPNSSHAEFRLFGHFTPTDAAPGNKTAKGRRVETGGALEAPAMELVSTAGALGKLDELGSAVTNATTGSERGKLALLALIRTEQGRDDEARDALVRLKPMLAEVPADAPDWTRWPELVAASHAVSRPALRPPAGALLDILAIEKPPEPVPPNSGYEVDPETGLTRTAQAQQAVDVWVKHARRAQAIARRRDDAAKETENTTAAWSPVIQGRAQTRGEGHPRASWSRQATTWSHEPGHDRDALYLNVPLQGEFEVEYEVATAPGQSAQIVYGGLGFGVRAGGRDAEVWSLGRTPVEYPIDPALKDVKDWYACRLVVRDGSYSAYVNGRKIHEQGLAPGADPWLALHVHAQHSAQIRNVAIKGQPTIPAQLELSHAADLGGWLATYYNEPMIGERRAWEKRGDEIFGRLKADPAGCHQESLLQYHRPLLEDGAVEYEFFYEPGKIVAHPALDRLTFLLDADGVRVHWLTDAQYDRSHTDPGNAQVEPAQRREPARLPLKPRDWNKLSLSITGDTATLTLNGMAIYERALDATNQRVFGLFHFADETEVRVRNVVYRGNWPRTLPAEVLGTRREP